MTTSPLYIFSEQKWYSACKKMGTVYCMHALQDYGEDLRSGLNRTFFVNAMYVQGKLLG